MGKAFPHLPVEFPHSVNYSFIHSKNIYTQGPVLRLGAEVKNPPSSHLHHGFYLTNSMNLLILYNSY